MLLTAHESRKEIIEIPTLDLRCRRWHPAKITGVLRIASFCPAYPFANCFATCFTRESSSRDRAKGSAGTFQRGIISGTLLRLAYSTSPETHFSTALPQAIAQLCENSRRTASLDELAEPNNYSNSLETSSTHLFASHLTRDEVPGKLRANSVNPQGESVSMQRDTSLRSGFRLRAPASLTPAGRLNLLNPSADTTLRVFHSI
jgi:hypothetical protein